MARWLGRFVELLLWFGDTIVGETVWGTSDVSCVAIGASSCFPVSLERTVCPQVGPLDPVNGPSKHICYCVFVRWALVSAPALVLDSFLLLLSTSPFGY